MWRGIEAGLELLKKGIIWRIGNGKSIQIQRDQWIPRKEGLKSTTFIRRSRLRWFNQLMHQDRKEWNIELIRQNFHNFDAEEICKIRIPRSDMEDCIAWHYEKNGVFSVRSAYKLAASIQGQASQSPSTSSSEAQDDPVSVSACFAHRAAIDDTHADCSRCHGSQIGH